MKATNYGCKIDAKMANLQVLAGPLAYQHIRQQGLQPQDIAAVFGASGAAKWLSIHGLDVAILAHWLPQSKQPVELFGTSVAAWKFAAAAQTDTEGTLNAFAKAYIEQDYEGLPRRPAIDAHTQRIATLLLHRAAAETALRHPKFRISIGAVRCTGLLRHEDSTSLVVGMTAAACLNTVTRHPRLLQRFVFKDPRGTLKNPTASRTAASHIALTPQNFAPAIISSSAIPYFVSGVRNIPGAPQGMYRDGGLLDYHPVPRTDCIDRGLILYPHFYPYLIPGWFDKAFRQRRASGQQLTRVLLLAPSPKFVAQLPAGRLSDRHDFKRLQNQHQLRITQWRQCQAQSQRLGEEFLHLVETGEIAERVQLLT